MICHYMDMDMDGDETTSAVTQALTRSRADALMAGEIGTGRRHSARLAQSDA